MNNEDKIISILGQIQESMSAMQSSINVLEKNQQETNNRLSALEKEIQAHRI